MRETYLKFNLQSLATLSINNARLRMFVANNSTDAQNIKGVTDDSWTEGSITYANKPSMGSVITTFTPTSVGTWTEVDITAAVSASKGTIMSLGIDNTSGGSNGYAFNSEESTTDKLQLVVSWGAVPTGTPTPTPGPTPPPGGSFSFAVAGDYGQNSNTTSVLNAINTSGATFTVALGDFSYVPGSSEIPWCNFVKASVGSTYPFELLAGNHEDVVRDGQIDNYVQCLPHRLTPLTGVYGKEYYFDYPSGTPLARFIQISPNLTYPGEGTYSYAAGTPRYIWTANAIDQARAAGIKYVVVSMHKYCLALVSGSCEIGPDLMNLLISKKADLVFQAHDHAYSRSKQLAHGPGCTALSAGSFNANCVKDSDNNFAYGAGTVIATVGTGGIGINSQSGSDPEAGYFATFQGSGSNPTFGALKFNVSSTSITAQFIRGAGGSFQDTFTIQ
jgi:Calcineurin-like phosphoesterase